MVEKNITSGKTERTAKKDPKLRETRGERSLAGYAEARGKGPIALTYLERTRVRHAAKQYELEQHAYNVASGRDDDILGGAPDNNTSDW